MTFPHAHQCVFSFSLSNLLKVKGTKIQEKGCLPFLSSQPRGTDGRMQMELFLPLSGQKIKADLDGEAEEGEKLFFFSSFPYSSSLF